VVHLELPRGSTQEDALRLIADLHEPMLQRDRPLFRAWVIDGLPDDCFAIYIKIHHAIIDGISAARRIQASLSTSRRAAVMPPPFAVQLPRHKATPPPEFADRMSSLAALAREQVSALRSLSVNALRKAYADVFGEGPSGSLPFRAHPGPMNRPMHTARSLATLTLPFDEMRAVGKHFGATLNDVAVTVVDHAVHRYLREIESEFPHRLIAMLPISLRDEHDHGGGTKASAMFAQLGEDEAGVVDRLHQVMSSVATAKQELRSMSNPAAMMYAVAALGVAELAAVTHADRVTRPLANLVISNVPGGREAGFLGGAQLIGTFPISAIAASVGLNVTLTSAHDRMDFGFVGDGITMPNLERMAAFTREALEELQVAARPGRRAQGRASRRKR
jgi:WS/DGAT/MGAT family acyltransferase